MEQECDITHNFNVEWLKTVLPMDTQQLLYTQQQHCDSSSTQTYKYACPRCEVQAADDAAEPRPLSYIYRFWVSLRDPHSQLDGCLLEADLAASFLATEPLKFFTNPAKTRNVYAVFQRSFNRKFLFTLETFRVEQPHNAEPDRAPTMLYRIAQLAEIASWG